MAGGCGARPASPPATRERAAPAPAVHQLPLRLRVPRARLTALVIESNRKRVLGRTHSLRDVERVIHEAAPLLRQAADQPAARQALREIAADMGISADQARDRWLALQEACILLESGGDPEAVSASQAVGVAQWMHSTGRRAGLRIDLAASRRLTARIAALRAAGKPSREAAAEVERLRARRRQVDQRYDPRAALFAQTRYLLGLYNRFPSLDWVFQAFHGGEAGARRTLQRCLGRRWPGSTAAAIRHGRPGGRLTYEDVYFGITPRSHAAAFAYLYSRGDDHRFYWWKLRAAQEGIARWRRDPAAFRAEWESLLPGRPKEAWWHPRPELLLLGPERADVDRGVREGLLVPLRSLTGIQVRGARGALRPEAAGALALAVREHRAAGGRGPLLVGDTALSQKEAERVRQSMAREQAARGLPPPPEPLWGGGPPPDFNYHATGLAFDLLAPQDPPPRRLLEYALSQLSDRDILWWRSAGLDTAGETPHFHVVPNPHYSRALSRLVGRP